MEIKTRTRKWGNSIGVILPKILVDSRKIKENEEITIEVKTRPIARDFFGRYPRISKKSAQELKDEARKGWD